MKLEDFRKKFSVSETLEKGLRKLGVWGKFKKNLEENYKETPNNMGFLVIGLDISFVWSNTAEGFTFWRDIDRKIENGN